MILSDRYVYLNAALPTFIAENDISPGSLQTLIDAGTPATNPSIVNAIEQANAMIANNWGPAPG